jgi:hypothetical protein
MISTSGQLHAPAVSSPGQEPQVPISRKMGEPQNWAKRYGEENL